MTRPLYRSELVEGDLVWLVTITYAGRDWRFATEVVSMDDRNGNTIVYGNLIEAPSITEDLDLFGSGTEPLQVPLVLEWPESVGVLAGKGHRFQRATAEVAVWVSGGAYEDREILISNGRVIDPQYGGVDDEVRLTVARRLFDARRLFPPASAVVNATTWPNRQEDTEGRVYPWVFGQPGVYTDEDGTEAYAAATPALFVDTSGDRLLIAGHRVKATQVRVYQYASSGTLEEDISVTHVEDGAGRTVAIVDITAAVTLTGTTTDEYWVDWRHGGALPSFKDAASDNPMQGAGECVQYMLETAGEIVDRGRMRSARVFLDQSKLAFYIDAFVSPWEWIADHIQEVFPVSLRAGNNGWYLDAWQLDGRTPHAVATLTAGTNVTAEGLITEENVDIVNALRMQYAQAKDSFRLAVEVTGDPWSASGVKEVHPTAYSRISQARYDAIDDQLESHIVWDTPTARALINRRIRVLGFPRRLATYSAAATLAWVRPGQLVQVEDTDRGVSQLALVQSRQFQGSDLFLTVLLVDDPPRAAKVL